MEGDELHLGRPPLFKGQNYEVWKIKMIGLIQYNGMELINIINQYEIDDKILRILPTKWRAQKTALRTSKHLEAMPLEELVGIFTIYEQVIHNDANNASKEKNIMIKISHKGKKKVPSKAFEDIDNTSDDTKSNDEISILTNKIKRMFGKQERGQKVQD